MPAVPMVPPRFVLDSHDHPVGIICRVENDGITDEQVVAAQAIVRAKAFLDKRTTVGWMVKLLVTDVTGAEFTVEEIRTTSTYWAEHYKQAQGFAREIIAKLGR